MSACLLVALAFAATPTTDRALQSLSSYNEKAAITPERSPVDSTPRVDSVAQESAAPAAQKDQRAPAVWRSDIRAALRSESSTQGAQREAAVHRLLKLYAQLGQPTNLVDSEQRQLRAQVRSRLQRTSQTLAKQARRRTTPTTTIAADGDVLPTTLAAASPPAHVALPDEILAQQLGPVGPVQFPLGQQGGQNPLGQAAGLPLQPLANVNLLGPNQSPQLAELIRTVIAPDKWDPNGAGAVLAQQIGQPGRPAAPGGQNAAQRQNADAGLELVELIQHTIAPDSWDVNGGPGTIMYFSPLRVLVVRQTDEVHDTLGGLIQGLRN